MGSAGYRSSPPIDRIASVSRRSFLALGAGRLGQDRCQGQAANGVRPLTKSSSAMCLVPPKLGWSSKKCVILQVSGDDLASRKVKHSWLRQCASTMRTKNKPVMNNGWLRGRWRPKANLKNGRGRCDEATFSISLMGSRHQVGCRQIVVSSSETATSILGRSMWSAAQILPHRSAT